MAYEPSPEVIERYAKVLVEFGIADGGGLKPGQTVEVIGSEETKPLYAAVCREIWRHEGNVIQSFRMAQDDRFNLERDFLELATDTQLDHFPATYQRGLMDEIDAYIYIDGSDFPKAMAGVDAQKMLRNQASNMPMMEWMQKKEAAGDLFWTIGLYGTEAMATEAGLSVEDYWQQIIHACFLDDADPVVRWVEAMGEIQRYRDWLNSLPIDRVHVEADEIDLWLTLGEHRKWVGGTGRNIPSFEIFTSPDWRGTEGHVKFSEPLYTNGALVTGARLEFKDGEVVSVSADANGQLLEQIVNAPGGNRLGEFSMTDASLSRIDRFMATTLYDENMGGPFGNTHMAVGMALQDCYDGDSENVTDEQWEELGMNVKAAVHTDIVSTTDRTVTAVMRDGSSRVIYSGGHFQID